MRLPGTLKDQLRLYEREGFTLKSIERASRHYRVVFHEVPSPQFLSMNSTDRRGWKNNVTYWKRLMSA